MSRGYNNDLLSVKFSFKSHVSAISFTWGGAPNCVWTCPAKITSVRGGIIRWVEWSEKLRVMIWLCILERYCQYASHSVFANFAITSLWIFALSFQLLWKSFKSGSIFELHSFTRLVEWKVWFIASTMFFDTLASLATTNSTFLIHASQSVNRMSLCVSSILSRLVSFLLLFLSIQWTLRSLYLNH